MTAFAFWVDSNEEQHYPFLGTRVIDGFHHVTCHTLFCVGGRATYDNMAMQTSAYLSSLPWEARKRYTDKLKISGVTLPDLILLQVNKNILYEKVVGI